MVSTITSITSHDIHRTRTARRGRRVSTALALCLAALFALFAGVARAEVPNLVSNGRFASKGALGVAVDQPSGDLFVMGFLALGDGETVELQLGISQKFDASGKVLSPPSPFAEGLHYGAAVNPMNGHLYVASPFGEIAIYDPDTGESLSSFAVPPFAEGFDELFANLTQIATDSAGNVYVPNPREHVVREYSESGELQHEFTGSGAHSLKEPTGVAVDSSGDLWVADTGNGRVEELEPSGAFVSEFDSEGVRALALDGHGHVLAILDNSADFCKSLRPPCDHLVEYSSTGSQLADVGAGYFGSSQFPNFAPQESMVAVDEASGRVYVSDGYKDLVWVFQRPLPPTLSRESAVEVGTSEAKLSALVGPGGTQATYRFEYDTREYAEGEGPHGVSVPVPEGSVGEGFSSRTVWASAKGLEPGTTYHYRAIVANGLGSVVGPDETFTTQTPAQVSCPNEQARGGFSAVLPDCRAYEMVTPPSKSSAEPDTGHLEYGGTPVSPRAAGGLPGNYVAYDGNRFSYLSDEVMPGSQSAGLEFVATRGSGGWSSQDALPLQPYTGDRCTFKEESGVLGYSSDLSRRVIVVNQKNGSRAGSLEAGRECQGEVVEIASGEPLGEENLLLHDDLDSSYHLINVTPPGVTPAPPTFVAGSADLRVVVIADRAKLTSDALDNAVNLYEWRDGTVHLLKFLLPAGTPAEGSFKSISPDGSEVFFTAGENLYARLNHGERTIQLDEARGGSGPGGGGSFRTVTADGSQVFFADDASAGLTSDTHPGSGENLYRYDVDSGRLTDLTPVSEADASLGGVSEDGSYVYFSSRGVQLGSQANQFGETAEDGHPNLYVEHGGTITFVMHGEGGRISSNGAFLAFDSSASLTGYENDGQSEIFLYSAASKRFVCASCNPSGEAPAGGVILGGGNDPLQPLSDNGQVFFQTAEALSPRDTNGQVDVYEYGWDSGLHLISSGTSSSESYLLNSSPSGGDVFFLTRQKLVPQDSFEEANKIYDARVDGGFPEPALPPACTTADACRSAATPQPSIFGEPASQTFSGAGNLTSPPPTAGRPVKPKLKQCRKGYVKKKGRCVKAKQRKRARKTSHKGRR